ncbi:signal peptidase I [Clostridium sp. YIM B02515]|uniref:Signal peptidase I n=1 Tax=Clostridium rhizosphaerae TaxID=2803861 RepID=A0ABS1TDQ2_9CLOT|nr:signal peptidase I [Clostridium rhizosphaerae]MBL4937513.1 signal peptidase I [Clostridium rhizosphaerae]
MNKRLINFLLVLMLGIIYTVDNLSVFTFNKKSYFIYGIKPILWILVILFVSKLPKLKGAAKSKYKKFLTEWVVYLAVFYIVIQVMGGFIQGFGSSPYDLSPLGIFKNAVLLLSTLVGKEKIRAYLINNGSKDKPWIRISFAVVLLTIINLPLNKALSLKGNFEIMKFFGETVLPQLSMSIMAAYLVYLDTERLSIIYLVIVQGILYISPILPNLQWIATAIMGGLSPIFSMMLLQYFYLKESKGIKKRDINKEKPAGLIITSLISVIIIWFSMGVFPVYPAVIATGSMKPLINPGDVVLVKRLKEADVKTGDIVAYKKDNIYIFHRITKLVDEKNEIKYETKGDNNSIADSELVSIDMIKGKVINIVPKIGWPTLILKDSRNKVLKEKVEF